MNLSSANSAIADWQAQWMMHFDSCFHCVSPDLNRNCKNCWKRQCVAQNYLNENVKSLSWNRRLPVQSLTRRAPVVADRVVLGRPMECVKPACGLTVRKDEHARLQLFREHYLKGPRHPKLKVDNCQKELRGQKHVKHNDRNIKAHESGLATKPHTKRHGRSHNR